MRALDTNVVLFHILNDKKFGQQAGEIIKRIEDGEEIFLPLPVLKETLFALLARGRKLNDIIEKLSAFQKDNIFIAEDNFAIFIQGLENSKKYGIGPTDGVIVALMLKHNVSEIYSNDPDFDKVPGIKRVF